MLKIVTAPNHILSQKAKDVLKIDKSILGFIEEMREALALARDPEGVGLAAPQVGKSLAIFIAKPSQKSPILTFINPKIVLSVEYQSPSRKGSSMRHAKLEGCLSLPNIWGQVKRSPELTLSFLDEKGKSHIKKYKSFMAIIAQHEIDHLNGILFTKRVLEQKSKLYKSYRDEEGEDVFEELEV
ncbi:MAG: peptide deformylase [Patescibacteria group bacterium]|nr:peptide deformylase [Patescibacteria group bacterium]